MIALIIKLLAVAFVLTINTSYATMNGEKEVVMKRDELGRFIKGYHFSSKTEFKKGDNKGKENPNWKGGRYFSGSYWRVLKPEHPRATKKGYVYEHVLVAEKKIGRYLKDIERVHHLNGVKTDNRPENIVVCKNAKEHFGKHTLKEWSKKYDRCRKCKTNDRKHDALGLCRRCYEFEQWHNRLDKWREKKETKC